MTPQEATRNKRILQAEKKGLTDEQNRNLNAAAAEDDKKEALALDKIASCDNLATIILRWTELTTNNWMDSRQQRKEKKLLEKKLDSLVARTTDTATLSHLWSLCDYGSYPEELIQERMLNC